MHSDRPSQQLASPTRRGSALVLIIAFIMIGSMLIYRSSTRAADRIQEVTSTGSQNVAMGALESVLTRRESVILSMAEVGDPANFERMHNNYGEEYFADCRVRWKIEPAIIQQVMKSKGDTDGDGIEEHDASGWYQYITNPAADFTTLSTDENEVQNDFIYIYRISGEARHLPGGMAWNPEDPRDIQSRVQAARYVAITKTPVFRYVIFYAQEGPKGDLEFTHGPELNVFGSVQCNGAIYVGADLWVNKWGALNPETISSIRRPTRIGPDVHGSPVRVNGVDGIFRLDKKTLYGAVNSWITGAAPIPYNPADGLGEAFYNISPGFDAVGERGGDQAAYPRPLAAVGANKVFQATHGGTIINPNRVIPQGNAASDPTADTVPTPVSLATVNSWVSINNSSMTWDAATETATYANEYDGGLFGVPVDLANVSGGALTTMPANDARSTGWRLDAMQAWENGGFGGFARTRENGGSILRLPGLMIDRAFEAQKIEYPGDLDGDPLTDEHEYARPIFVTVDGAETTAIPAYIEGDATSPPIIEAPPQYLQYALGPNRFFARMTDTRFPEQYDLNRPTNAKHAYNGWYVTDDPATGNPASGNPDEMVGLVIRERPQPDESYFSTPAPVSEDSFYYMPFAYGKHSRVPIWPLWPIDVVATRLTQDTSGKTIDSAVGYDFQHGSSSYINRYTDWFHFNLGYDRALYADGGKFDTAAAMDPGPDGTNGFDNSGYWLDGSTAQQDGWWDDASGTRRYPDYFRENWRLFHMQRPLPDKDALGTGWVGKYWNNVAFTGNPVKQLVDRPAGSIDKSALGLPNNRFSARWQGFIKAPDTGPYRFVGRSDDGIRIWVNGKLVVDQWRKQGAADRWGLVDGSFVDILMEEDQYYPIVVEYFEWGSGEHCQVKWLRPTDDWSAASNASDIPTSVMAPMLDTAFRTEEVKAVQMRLTDLSGPTRQKAGLMVRAQGVAGISNLGGGNSLAVDLSAANYVGQINGQGHSGTLSYGDGATADGNQWPIFNAAYEIKLETTLTFELNVAAEPELVGVSLQAGTGLEINPKRVFHMAGTQAWGSGYSDFTYDTSALGTWQTFTIPIGTYYTGSMNYFVLMNDEDANRSGRVTRIRNVRLETPDPDVIDTANLVHVPHIADGRDPYLALLYSPERGVFTQRRLDRTATRSYQQATYFIGTKDGLPNSVYVSSAGETPIDADAVSPAANPRTVGLWPELVTPTHSYGNINNAWGGHDGKRPKRDDLRWSQSVLKNTDGSSRDWQSEEWFNNYENGVIKSSEWQQIGNPKKVVLGENSTDGTPAMELRYFFGDEVRMASQYNAKLWRRETQETWRFHLMPGERDNENEQLFDDAQGTSLSDFQNPVWFFPTPTAASDNVFWHVPKWGYHNSDQEHWRIEPTYLERTWEAASQKQCRGNNVAELIATALDHGITLSAEEAAKYVAYSDSHPSHWNEAKKGVGTVMAQDCLFWYYNDDVRASVYDADGNTVTSIGNGGRMRNLRPFLVLYKAVNGQMRPHFYPHNGDINNLQIGGSGGIDHRFGKSDGFRTIQDMIDSPLLDDHIQDVDDFYRIVEENEGLPLGSLTAQVGSEIDGDAVKAGVLAGTPFVNKVLFADPGWPVIPEVALEVPDPQPTMNPLLDVNGDQSDWTWDYRVEQYYNKPAGWYAATYKDGQPDINGNPESTATLSDFRTTFQLERQRTIYTDINPYITRLGVWYTPQVPMSIDWPAWSTASERPLTGSFRPDQWYGVAAPADATTLGVAGPGPLANGDYDGVVPKNTGNRAQRIDAPWFDDIPVTVTAADDVWLRIERVAGTDNFQLKYCVWPSASTQPSASDFTVINGAAGTPLLIDSRIFGSRSLIGPCLQSGDQNNPSSFQFSDLSMEFTNDQPGYSVAAKAEPENLLDMDDWEQVDDEGATYTTKYLCSQYQVFWGPYDITEAFFSYRDVAGELCADEVWIYNTREFGSQSRWWACGAEKEQRFDSNGNPVILAEYMYPVSPETRTYRELWAKQTQFVVNMAAVNNFLKSVDLQAATDDVAEGGYDDRNKLANSGPLLNTRFNGLFHVSRTNRYPWNPNLDLDNQSGHNPWTWPLQMPNQTQAITGITEFAGETDLLAVLLGEDDPIARRALFTRLVRGDGTPYDEDIVETDRLNDINTHPLNRLDGTGTAASLDYALLQPYELGNAPALKPTDFHHGVRLTRAEAIDWGLPNASSGGAIASGSEPEFGASKSLFVTPNQLYLHGDVNTMEYLAITDASTVPSVIEQKITPFAVVGDSVNLLSNLWNDEDWQEPGIIFDDDEVIGGGSLARPWTFSLPEGDATTYNTSIITHNIPTSRTTVRDGEAASIVTVLQFMENWWGIGLSKAMTFRGSLVVMDSRRYTQAYLLDVRKDYGRTPFGTMGWHQGRGFHEDGLNTEDLTATPPYRLTWGEETPESQTFMANVYNAPTRRFLFNEDLLTSAGTPPFTPFGVTSTGTGGWVNVIK